MIYAHHSHFSLYEVVFDRIIMRLGGYRRIRLEHIMRGWWMTTYAKRDH